MEQMKQWIQSGDTSLGIEFGSTRIKAVLIAPDHTPIAQGDYTWENQLVDGIWTYALEDVWKGLQSAYAAMAADVLDKCGVPLTTIGSIGISAMMHGYLAFDKEDNLLVPFRTWRNTITGEAADALTAEFNFNIPQRWSISHLYQAILNGEEHVPAVTFFTTLAGYVHWQLTGEKVLGVGDASGMFPIDSETCNYNAEMVEKFNKLVENKHFPWKLADILPTVLNAGAEAGVLTPEGAKLLDPTGTLQAGVPLCPPEGDAGTGMTATNSVAVRTGNVSAGTSIFSMVVLEKPLSKVYPELDLVTTPDGAAVAMVHCNNCTNELNAWASLFGELLEKLGVEVSGGKLFTTLFNTSLEGDADCSGVIPVNYLSGEGVTHFDAGRPLLVRSPESKMTLANFMRGQIYSAMATMCSGMELLELENVKMDRLMGHGGLFKTPGVAQSYLAAATGAPVTCMETAGEGGPYGAALLAAYAKNKAEGETLAQYLDNRVFAGAKGSTIMPDADIAAGFKKYMERYKAALAVERTAVEKF